MKSLQNADLLLVGKRPVMISLKVMSLLFVLKIVVWAVIVMMVMRGMAQPASLMINAIKIFSKDVESMKSLQNADLHRVGKRPVMISLEVTSLSGVLKIVVWAVIVMMVMRGMAQPASLMMNAITIFSKNVESMKSLQNADLLLVGKRPVMISLKVTSLSGVRRTVVWAVIVIMVMRGMAQPASLMINAITIFSKDVESMKSSQNA